MVTDKKKWISTVIHTSFIILCWITLYQFMWFRAKGMYHGMPYDPIYLPFAIVGWILIYLAIFSDHPKRIRNRFITGLLLLSPLLIHFVAYTIYYTNQVIFENCRIEVWGGGLHTESVPELINTVILGWITIAIFVVLIILTVRRMHRGETKKLFLTTPAVLCALNAVISLCIAVYCVTSIDYYFLVGWDNPSFALLLYLVYPITTIAHTYRTLVPLFVPAAVLFASIPLIITKKWLLAAILLFLAGALTFPLGILGIIGGIVCLYYCRAELRKR